MSIGKYLKKYLIAGLLVWLPIAVTIWLIGYIINATDWLANLVPQKWQPENYIGFNIPGQGFIIAIIVLLITGIFAANMLGRKFLEAWDSLLGRIPVVKSIYSSVKKVSESLFSDNVSVYVPTTPNPTGGYYIMVRRSDIRELNMNVDEALKYVISLGMVMPNDPHVIAQPEKAEAKES